MGQNLAAQLRSAKDSPSLPQACLRHPPQPLHQRLAGQGASTLLTSHYAICRGAEVAEFLGESRAYVERVDQALVAELQGADGGRSLRQLCDALGPVLGEWPAEASAYLCFPLMGHLERLVQHERVEMARRDGVVEYRWK